MLLPSLQGDDPRSSHFTPLLLLMPLSPHLPSSSKAYQMDNVPLPMGFVESEHLAAHRQAIVIVNPHKIRMSPLLEWHETDVVRGVK